KHGAALVRAVADRDHVVPGLAEEPVEGLGGVPLQIDADLAHGLDGERVHARGLRARARHLEAVARLGAEEALRHLAAGGVVSAEEEDTLLVHAGPSGYALAGRARVRVYG